MRGSFLASAEPDGSLRHLSTLETDVVIVGVAECGCGAAELCARLRASFGFKPILVLENGSEESDKVIALEAGADDYVVKPFLHAN